VIKKLAGGIRTALAQYRELAAFAQFASDLDEATRKQLDRGRLVTELLKQAQYEPKKVSQLAVMLYAVEKGFADDVKVEKALAFEAALYSSLKTSHAAIIEEMDTKGELSGDNDKKLADAIKSFKATGSY